VPPAAAQPRQLALETPLGPGALSLVGFSGREELSRLFAFRLDLVADNATVVPFDQLVGRPMTVGVGGGRFFNGIVSRLSEGARDGRSTGYRAELVPQLWLLTRSRGSRIFQNASVPDVLRRVLSDAGVGATFELEADYPPRNYCVQYRETAFDFVSRLMEDEGIFYFFRHSESGHELVIADAPASVRDVGTFPFDERNPGRVDPPRVLSWQKTQELTSGKITLRDHSFELPHNPLEGTATIAQSAQAGQVTHQLRLAGNDSLELYDYPGGYAKRFDGVGPGGGDRPQDLQRLAQAPGHVAATRMLEEAARSLTVASTSTCRTLSAGAAVTIAGHFDANGAYLLTAVDHSASQPAGAVGAGGFAYANAFAGIPASVPFRPARVTPSPVAAGSETAVVVGPAGEETFTDRYGRVKVKFFWDREGQADEHSSCWIRVAQPIGGAAGGLFWVPEIGDEVLVAFLEGDPDRPLIAGRLFNADDPPRGSR
jgi:type VI secretion system secreted protein VgrG